MYYTYVMYNKLENKFYIGVTADIKKRITEHIQRKTLSSRRIKPVKLIYCEMCLSSKDARAREKQLKTGFGRGYLRRRLKNYLVGL